MSIKEIPLIIGSYNQLTYLKILVAQFKFYYPDNPVWIIDNGSTYKPLLDWLETADEINVVRTPINDFIGNLRQFIDKSNFEYYLISDPDINLPPYTPPYFLEVFKHIVDSGFHRAGFGLKTSDIPEWNKKAGWIQGDEKALLRTPLPFVYEGKEIIAYKAPIDTTWALYKRSNGGWSAPMSGKDWDNSVRVFEAYHMTWYLHHDHLNEEMKNYFNTCLKRDDTKPSAGRNHFSPE